MLLKLKDRICQGSHADLIDPGDGWIYKVFRRAKSEVANRRARAAFGAELAAYRLAGDDPVLVNHIPRFEVVPIEGVVNRRGAKLSAGYFLDCGYRTERLAGPECPVFGWPSVVSAEADRLLERFDEVGVGYVVDASVFGAAHGRVMKFIDIATFDARE